MHEPPSTTGRGVRAIDERAIRAHADRRFRSEYDYALFEYYRSAKVIAFLERAGVTIGGRVLDAGCGGGGMPLSLADEARQVVGIDPINRFGDAGVRLAHERHVGNLQFAHGRWHGAAVFRRRLRPRALPRRDRARRRRAAVPPRMRSRARGGRPDVSVDGAVLVLRGSASAAPEGSRSRSTFSSAGKPRLRRSSFSLATRRGR